MFNFNGGVCMKKTVTLILVFLLGLQLYAGAWEGIKSDKFTIYYRSENEHAAKDLMKQLTEYGTIAEKNTGGELKRSYFVVDDFGVVVNGYADPMLSDSIHTFVFPPQNSELSLSENWYRTVGIHEYTHMLHLKRRDKIPKVLTMLYGNMFQPNIWSPPFMIEGITVFTESDFSKYSGRLNDGYYDAYAMARLNDNMDIDICDATFEHEEYPYGNFYLYGGLFFRYLSQKYGKDKFDKLFELQGSSAASYLSPFVPAAGIDRQVKKVYGKSLPKLWKEWVEFEKERAKSYKREGSRIAEIGERVDGLAVNSGYIYYVRSYHNMVSADQSHTKYGIYRRALSDLTKEELVFDYVSRIYPKLFFGEDSIYFTALNYAKGFSNVSQQGTGAVKDLHKYNLKKREDEIIFSEKLRTFALTENGDIIYSKDRTDKFGSKLYKIEEDGRCREIAEYDILVNEIVSKNGNYFVSAKRENSNFDIYEIDGKNFEIKNCIGTEYVEGSLSVAGDRLYFISNNESVYRCYSMDLNTKELFKESERGYVNSPVYDSSSGNIYYAGLGGKGNELWEAKPLNEKTAFENSQPEKTELKLNKTDEVKYKKTSYLTNYLSLLAPTNRSFNYDNSKSKKEATIILIGSDKIGEIPVYTLAYSYKKENGKVHSEIALYAETNLMLPVETNFTIDDDGTDVEFRYPLIYQSRKGVETVYIGSEIDSSRDYSKAKVLPFIYGSLNYPDDYLYFRTDFNVNKENIDGIRAELYGAHMFQSSKADLKAVWRDEEGNESWLDEIPETRGYSSSTVENGLYISLNYSLHLWKIRKGLWNPNIYFKDGGVTLFADNVFANDGSEKQESSYGVEFKQRAAAIFGNIQITPLARVAVKRDGEVVTEFVVSSEF